MSVDKTDHEHHWHELTDRLQECCQCGAIRALMDGGQWLVVEPPTDAELQQDAEATAKDDV